jgi:hypothetical protein
VALAVTPVVVPFPAGVVAATLAGTLQGIALATPSLPRAEAQILFALDQATPGSYVPLLDAKGIPVLFPVGDAGVCPVPQNVIPPLAKIQVLLTNFGGASATVDLITS